MDNDEYPRMFRNQCKRTQLAGLSAGPIGSSDCSDDMATSAVGQLDRAVGSHVSGCLIDG